MLKGDIKLVEYCNILQTYLNGRIEESTLDFFFFGIYLFIIIFIIILDYIVLQ